MYDTEIVAAEDVKAGDVILVRDGEHASVTRVARGKDAVLLILYMPDEVKRCLLYPGSRVARLIGTRAC